MHFIHSSLVALSMGAGLASAANPLACLKLPAAAMNVDMDKAVETLVEEACNKGCSPKLSEFDPKLRDVAVPVIQAETRNMGAPELEQPYTALLDSLFETATKECADEQILETDLCQDISQTKSIAQCVQNRAVALVFENAGPISKLSTTKCQEQVDFWSDPNVHEKAIPYIRQFVADGC